MFQFRLVVLMAIAVAAQAQIKMSVEQLISFIKSSVQTKQEDRKVAEYVGKIKLTNQLDDNTVEELQGMGAGPKTVVALRQLVDTSNTLPPVAAPPPKPEPVVIPPPDPADQKKILAEVTEMALNYTKNLPNYVCTQVTKRNVDPTGTEKFRLVDTIQEQLSFFDKKENYKVTMINGQMVTNKDHEKLGGAISSGEFGTMLQEIFAPHTETEFGWERWATLRGRRMYVFNFHVPQSRSQYSIYHHGTDKRIIAGYNGLIYADRDTGVVMRIKMECENLPRDFPIQAVALDLNYDFTKISDQEFVLPLRSEIRSREGRYLSKNEVSFHLYRKFGAEATITFDTPDATPDDKAKEQPAKPATPEGKKKN